MVVILFMVVVAALRGLVGEKLISSLRLLLSDLLMELEGCLGAWGLRFLHIAINDGSIEWHSLRVASGFICHHLF